MAVPFVEVRERKEGEGRTMRGWLLVNSFLESGKFQELYEFLCRASRRRGMALEIKRTDELLCDMTRDFAGMDLPDFVLFWDKDIYLAQRLEQKGLHLFNPARAIELCDNKILTGLSLRGRVPLPRTVIAPKTFEGLGYPKRDFLTRAVELLGLPMVVKEAYGSFGQQVYLAHTRRELEEIVDRLGHKEFLMQEFIASSEGRDIRANVVGGQVVSAMLRYNERDFRSNISNGGSMKAASLSPRWEQVAVTACEALGLDFGGVDLLFGEGDEPVVCEVNSNPHFKSSFDCTGVDMSERIMEYVKGCME